MTTDPTILAAAERCAACGAPVSRGSSVPRDATQCVVCEVAPGYAIVAVRRAWGRTGPRARPATPRATEIAAMGVRHVATPRGDRHAKHA